MPYPKRINVGITSIGSGVGQSVIDACRLSSVPLRTVGYGITPFAFGAFDCDEQHLLPSIYADEYLSTLAQACERDGIDILIPGLDDELILLADNIETFRNIGVQIPISGRRLLELCRDKGLMSEVLNRHQQCFVRSYTKQQLISGKPADFRFPMIAKPVSGFASRGLVILHGMDDLTQVGDTHVIQEIAAPSQADPHRREFDAALRKGHVLQTGELSLQLLFDRHGQEIGRFASYNRLNNGIPVEIVPADVPGAWDAVDRLIPVFKDKGLYGPLNIQGRLTDEGPRFFEMNARFTGITGLRALAGFNEVEAIILDAAGLAGKPHRLSGNARKIGIRQVKNRVIDISHDPSFEAQVRRTGIYPPIPPGRTVLVTGANSYLGRAVVNALQSAPGVGRVIALVRNPARLDGVREPALSNNVEVVDAAALDTGRFQFGSVDVVCHLASSRPGHPSIAMAESLAFTRKIVSAAIRHQVPGFINASSQSVYGTARPPMWREDLPPAPETVYAQTKLASEHMAATLVELNPASKAISLRFAQLIGPGTMPRPDELAHKYVRAALDGSALEVWGGQQQLDMLDVRDAAALVVALASAPYAAWPGLLNVSSGQPCTVLDLAHLALQAAASVKPTTSQIIRKEYQGCSFGMDNSKAKDALGWQPAFTLAATLADVAWSLHP